MYSNAAIADVETRTWWQRWAPVLVGAVSAALLLGLERLYQAIAPDQLFEGYRFQRFGSEDMMQTLGLNDMIAFGPRWIIFNHVYPPLEDLIRYAVSAPSWLAGQPVSLMGVDMWLYAIAAVGYGAVNGMVFAWIRSVTGSSWWSLGGTVAWAAAPGYIMTMQMLDPSPLATTFITASLFTLFMFLKSRNMIWATYFYASLLLASLSRSVVQPHVLLVILFSLYVFWRLSAKRSTWLLYINTLMVVAICAVPLKQQLLFGTLDASTFGGHHRSSMIWVDPRTVSAAPVADRYVESAQVFISKYNNEQNVRENITLTAEANRVIVEEPLRALEGVVKTLQITIPEAMRPSTDYASNPFVDRLPWKNVYSWFLSGWRYVTILVAAIGAVFWLYGWRWVAGRVRDYGWFVAAYAAFAVPLLVGNRYYPGQEDLGPMWTEITRQRIFIEPPLFVFVAFAFWSVYRRVQKLRSERGLRSSMNHG